MKLTAIILTKNEEENIASCLQSLTFCDEVLLIDDESNDTTIGIAKKHGAKVFQRKLDRDFAAQRNFGLEKAAGQWIVFIDADERVTQPLQEEILQLTSSDRKNIDGFYLLRNDVMWGKEFHHGEVGNAQKLRLVRKGKGRWMGKVHEELLVEGQIGLLASPFLHYAHQSIQEFLEHINFYTTIRAEELHNQGVHVSFLSMLLYPIGKFVQNYIVRLGFLDGTAGLIVALMMSLHSFLVRGKLWALWNTKK